MADPKSQEYAELKKKLDAISRLLTDIGTLRKDIQPAMAAFKKYSEAVAASNPVPADLCRVVVEVRPQLDAGSRRGELDAKLKDLQAQTSTAEFENLKKPPGRCQ